MKANNTQQQQLNWNGAVLGSSTAQECQLECAKSIACAGPEWIWGSVARIADTSTYTDGVA